MKKLFSMKGEFYVEIFLDSVDCVDFCGQGGVVNGG